MTPTLEDLKKAYYELLAGQSVTQVRTSNGKMITYAQADAQRLKMEINNIESRSRRTRTRTRMVTTSKGL